jgi:hypothetical protein
MPPPVFVLSLCRSGLRRRDPRLALGGLRDGATFPTGIAAALALGLLNWLPRVRGKRRAFRIEHFACPSPCPWYSPRRYVYRIWRFAGIPVASRRSQNIIMLKPEQCLIIERLVQSLCAHHIPACEKQFPSRRFRRQRVWGDFRAVRFVRSP